MSATSLTVREEIKKWYSDKGTPMGDQQAAWLDQTAFKSIPGEGLLQVDANGNISDGDLSRNTLTGSFHNSFMGNSVNNTLTESNSNSFYSDSVQNVLSNARENYLFNTAACTFPEGTTKLRCYDLQSTDLTPHADILTLDCSKTIQKSASGVFILSYYDANNNLVEIDLSTGLVVPKPAGSDAFTMDVDGNVFDRTSTENTVSLHNDNVFNVFIQASVGNELGVNSYGNRFEESSTYNTIGNGALYNAFSGGSARNILGALCHHNTLNSCVYVKLPNSTKRTHITGLTGLQTDIADLTPYSDILSQDIVKTIQKASTGEFVMSYDTVVGGVATTTKVVLFAPQK